MDQKVEVVAVEEEVAMEEEEEDGAEEDVEVDVDVEEEVVEGFNFLKVCRDMLEMICLLRRTVLGSSSM